MSINNCRVCGHSLYLEPLLQYKNMPASAQYFPGKNELKTDRGVNFKVCQCSGCGLVQLNSEPVPYYREVIRAAGFSKEMKDFRDKQFKEFVGKYSLDGKKIIEIGCGQGEYLEIMQDNKLDVFGLEYASKSVKQCVDKELNVFQGFIENSSYKIKSAPYDAFFILNFLEHLPNINTVLKGIRNNLTEEGLGIVEVPNFDMILKKNLFFEFIADHLFYFTSDTLKTVLNLNGFDVIECEPLWHNYIISAVVKKRRRLNLNFFIDLQKNLKKEIYSFLKKYKNVAIWGAGHEALTVMSMADLSDKIEYVIDSAPFKQGKYTLATHIPIMTPDELNLNPVGAVIVMAASYSDEVVSILRKNYSKDIKISVLRNFGLEMIN